MDTPTSEAGSRPPRAPQVGSSQPAVSAPVALDSPAVQSYLPILQGVITRMASNSANCKAWCVALVSAILVVVADTLSPRYVWIAGVPTALFCLLDAYYLGLESGFRDSYNVFIRKLHLGTATVDELFIVAPSGRWAVAKATAAALLSFSVLPFYGVLAVTIELARRLVLK